MNKKQKANIYFLLKTQREGFEPPEPCGSSAFEADAISQLDHRCMTPL